VVFGRSGWRSADDREEQNMTRRRAIAVAVAKDASNSKKVKVECVPADGGDIRSGGGAQVAGGGNDVALIASKPTGTHGWVAKAVEVSPTSEPWRLKVYAVCLDS
jgi:hypothetical protein